MYELLKAEFDSKNKIERATQEQQQQVRNVENVAREEVHVFA